jgi:hypothetical protein
VPYADPSIAEKYKAHKPDSDALEPRVTRSKSKLLNIDDLIKGTEVNASSLDSEFDAKLSSDAPCSVVSAINKKRKRSRVKFKKAKVRKTLDPSLPPTPTNITESINGPQGAEWAAALDHEMDSLKEPIVCSIKSTINLNQSNPNLHSGY